MNDWLRTLRNGDSCRIGTTDYVVRARISCRRADGESWTLWRLRPRSEVAKGDRWLECDKGQSMVLWQPADLPADVAPAELAQRTALPFDGRRYRRTEQDDYVIAHIGGNVDGGSRMGDRVRYADFASGDRRLRAEWKGDAVNLHAGQLVTPIAVLEWFDAADIDLKRRAAVRVQQGTGVAPAHTDAFGNPASRQRSNVEEGVFSVVLAVPIVLFLLFADGCSDDCTARVDQQTGRTEYACPDGSVRSSRGWFGK